jgi:predicted nucleic acid-binding Zn ribbon protein
MLKTYEYLCTNEECCNRVTRIVRDEDKDQQSCYFCNAVVERLPAAPAFTVKGFNAANRYSK